ncbi:hypothetical protein [Deinococcus aquiradiocola]|uniref:Uncharacterized protein n=1 Tax=Deinococcus aquiradiocola TaxID=393059 RepID=A0A917UL54_9DEIO|nr:hypothetical protein [Deinococcus aquiradiocola]GGJ65470.1 hypothetical protein GCM10008939_06770 [Deinococcus aquiradiocola]
MPQLKFFQVVTLPGTLQPNAFYYVLNGSYSESYLTNSTGVAKAIGNSAMINALIDAKLAAASTLQSVPTIAARNSAAAATTANALYLVTDATGDPTVTSGAALYFYEKAANKHTKVAEYESMDVVLQWANIQGRPNSTPAAIDAAVGASHTHGNKGVLDALTDSGGRLQYGGQPVNTPDWGSTDW